VIREVMRCDTPTRIITRKSNVALSQTVLA